MTPWLVASVAVVAIVLLVLALRAKAKARVRQLELSELRRSYEDAILVETTKRRESARHRAEKEQAAIPELTDAELEAEINK